MTLTVSLLELSEVVSFQERNTGVSVGRTKRMRNMFKNGNYLLQCTRNRGRFRVPLMMLTQYKGMQVFAVSNIHSTE